jgi:SAM-dependent methyltransferase
MSVSVLQRRADIDAAAARLRARGLQPRAGDGDLLWSLRSVLRTHHRPRRPDAIKSWDVERTLQAIELDIAPDERVVDLGAENSAVLLALARLGYRELDGVDLNPELALAPRGDRIRYHVSDFHSMPFLPDGSCGAVTAISTIEHGWRGPDLLREVSRVLRPGGIFAASTDYWPDKLDTTDRAMFGMSWTIFSRAEITTLLAEAASLGLVPAGDVHLDAAETVIDWNDRRYTFIHLVLRKAG